MDAPAHRNPSRSVPLNHDEQGAMDVTCERNRLRSGQLARSWGRKTTPVYAIARAIAAFPAPFPFATSGVATKIRRTIRCGRARFRLAAMCAPAALAFPTFTVRTTPKRADRFAAAQAQRRTICANRVLSHRRARRVVCTKFRRERPSADPATRKLSR